MVTTGNKSQAQSAFQRYHLKPPRPTPSGPTFKCADISKPVWSHGPLPDKLLLVRRLDTRMATQAPILPDSCFKDHAHGESLVKAINHFALDLYQHTIKSERKNVFFSPLSIFTALSMTYGGSRDLTTSEMEEVMHLAPLNQNIHCTFKELLGSLKSPSPQLNMKGKIYSKEELIDMMKSGARPSADYQLNMANKIYAKDDHPFLQDFISMIQTDYIADIEKVNFAKDAEAIRQNINRWVEAETANKIKDLIPGGVLDALTCLVLINAIYFKGDWATKFKRYNTENDVDFHISDTNKVKFDMMNINSSFYMESLPDLKSKVLELPYINNKLSMIILLPDEKNGISELENKLSIDILQTICYQVRGWKMEVDVSLPRFKMEQSFDLGNSLTTLGMKQLFQEGSADLSGINGTKELYVSKVLHKAFVEVNEEGSEAAAATAVVCQLQCARFNITPTFRCDHPFIFFIRDNRSNAILFMGKLATP
ncbi:unnamed protein product [Owenia fusiformis]|uniref:Uncharacterized protein n=1 Tax=Owenia fusiformis TaxID=6347 RepID=A0A8J1T735_OWEFU|nr:unnamed protein product [Owenia fusiformis]